MLHRPRRSPAGHRMFGEGGGTTGGRHSLAAPAAPAVTPEPARPAGSVTTPVFTGR